MTFTTCGRSLALLPIATKPACQQRQQRALMGRIDRPYGHLRDQIGSLRIAHPLQDVVGSLLQLDCLQVGQNALDER